MKGDPVAIERILHQTWKTEEIPRRFRSWVESVRRENPELEYRLWTDDDNLRLIEQHYRWFLPTYRAYRHPVERADAARYFIVHRFGGLYLDLDMEGLRPLWPLLDQDAVNLALEAGPRIEQQVVSNALIAAPRRHEFLESLIRALPAARRRDVTFGDVFDNTGPHFVSRLYAQHQDRHRFKILGLDQVCPVKVVSQNRALPSPDLATLRKLRALALLHHNTETWNMQLAKPERIPPGWVLFEDHDLVAGDLSFAGGEAHDAAALFEAADRVEGAIAVNYNYFVKGPGGELVATEGDRGWLKPGIRPWVCIRESALPGLTGSETESASVEDAPDSRRASSPAVPSRSQVSRTLISYANRPFREARDHCLETGANVGGFDHVRAYGPTDLDGEFVRRNLPLLGQRRGAGLWLWKPFIVLRALEEVSEGHWLLYADAGTEFLRSVEPIVAAAEDMATDLLFLGEGFRESQYTKRDAFVLLDCDDPNVAASPQRFASQFLVRNTEAMRQLFTSVLAAAEDPRILSDLPNTMGRDNYPDFVAHRHDQSILSLLSKKRGIPSPPGRPWVALGVADDQGQILNHTRRPRPARARPTGRGAG